VNTPNRSWDLGSDSGSRTEFGSGSDFSLENQFLYSGYVMSARFDGEKKCSKPEVEVGVKHKRCCCFCCSCSCYGFEYGCLQIILSEIKKRVAALN